MRARKRFAQHFLEPTWVEKVVAAIAPAPSNRFVEIGSGRGALTLALAPRVRTLTAIEIDRDLVRNLGPRLPDHVRLVQGNFLDLDPSVFLDPGPSSDPVRVAGNLPYNVSSPILFKLLEIQRGTSAFLDATVMVQREVAERMAAPEGSRRSGVLSIMIRLDADVERLLVLPPGAFRPQPSVTSELVRLHFRPAEVRLSDRKSFERLVRGVFTHRRKTMLNALKPLVGGRSSEAQAVLAEGKIEPTRRPETLHLVELARLAEVLRSGYPPSVV